MSDFKFSNSFRKNEANRKTAFAKKQPNGTLKVMNGIKANFK